MYREKLVEMMRAGYSGLAVQTTEVNRCETETMLAATQAGRGFWRWTLTQGWLKGTEDGRLVDKSGGTEGEPSDPIEGVVEISKAQNGCVFLMHVMDEMFREPAFRQALRDVLGPARESRKTIVLVGSFTVPADLDKELAGIAFDLPTREQIQTMVLELLEDTGIKPPENGKLAKVVDGMLGLTLLEAQNAAALSLVQYKELNVSAIIDTKKEIVKRDGVLEFIESTENLDTIGGLENLKAWLKERAGGFSPKAREFGVPAPRGLLICGIPGTGKSLTAKAVGNAWGLPVLRWDTGRSMGSLVGQSESLTRRVFELCEALAPVVLFVDEFEKMFAGARGSGSTDGGTTQRVTGSFLTWMQDRPADKPVFIVATANDIASMPPEMIRRFDAVFAVNLPNAKEREAIWRVHLTKLGRGDQKWNYKTLAEMSEDFTGSEIEEAVKSALWSAFSDGQRDLTEKDLRAACEATIPLAKGPMKDAVELLAQDNRFKPASIQDAAPKSKTGKRVVEAR